MQGFGAGGTGGMPGSAEFNDAATQYWNAWGEMMRRAGGAVAPAAPAAPAQPSWSDVAGWWSNVAGAGAPTAPKPAAVTDNVDELMRRFNAHAGGWYAQMQQLASQFAGQNASPADIASAWRQALGGSAANPFADVFAGMSQQPGQMGFDAWFRQIAPFLQAMQGMQTPSADMTAWLGLPTFGFTREHQQRIQQLMQAQLEYQQKNSAYTSLMSEATQQAFVRFEEKLKQRTQPGQQIASARALFDLWIDAAEESYAEIALSTRFREVYGQLVNAQMRLRGAVQREVELMGEMVGMPTRTEMDSTHRKIVQLEREMRRLRDRLATVTADAATNAPASPDPVAETMSEAKTAAAAPVSATAAQKAKAVPTPAARPQPKAKTAGAAAAQPKRKR